MRTELRRQFVHGLGSINAVILYFLGKDGMVAFTLFAIAAATVLASHRGSIKSPLWNLFENFVKSHERQSEKPFMGLITFSIGMLLAVVLFTVNIAALCIVILAVGDSVSTLIGKLYGKHKLPINSKKSWEGSIAFFLSVLVILLMAAEPVKAAEIALFVTIVEGLPRLDDNITIPVAAGFALMFL